MTEAELHTAKAAVHFLLRERDKLPLSERVRKAEAIDRLLRRRRTDPARRELVGFLEGLLGPHNPAYPREVATYWIAEVAGLGSKSNYYRAREIVRKTAGRPNLIYLLERMDATGSPNSPYEELKHILQGEREATGELFTKRERQRGATACQRMGVAVSSLEGYADGLGSFDVERAVLFASAEDLARWRAGVNKALAALRQLKAQLNQGGSRGNQNGKEKDTAGTGAN